MAGQSSCRNEVTVSFRTPTPLPTGIEGWLETFAGGILGCLDPADRTVARDEVAALLRPALCDDQGRWHADYVRLRFAARLPG